MHEFITLSRLTSFVVNVRALALYFLADVTELISGARGVPCVRVPMLPHATRTHTPFFCALYAIRLTR
jgi:hypothetical protein